jgi:hypothetical protein
MVTKTIIVKGDGSTIEHSGTSGVTITLDANKKTPYINIEYDMVSGTEMITMIKDLLGMVYERMPGVAENAIKYFAEENDLVDDKTGLVHVRWKKAEK